MPPQREPPGPGPEQAKAVKVKVKELPELVPLGQAQLGQAQGQPQQAITQLPQALPQQQNPALPPPPQTPPRA